MGFSRKHIYHNIQPYALNAIFYAKQAEYVQFYARVIIPASGDNASAGLEILLASGSDWEMIPGRNAVLALTGRPILLGAFYCPPKSDITKPPN
jgi:hypothetical protein